MLFLIVIVTYVAVIIYPTLQMGKLGLREIKSLISQVTLGLKSSQFDSEARVLSTDLHCFSLILDSEKLAGEGWSSYLWGAHA